MPGTILMASYALSFLSSEAPCELGSLSSLYRRGTETETIKEDAREVYGDLTPGSLPLGPCARTACPPPPLVYQVHLHVPGGW